MELCLVSMEGAVLAQSYVLEEKKKKEKKKKTGSIFFFQTDTDLS